MKPLSPPSKEESPPNSIWRPYWNLLRDRKAYRRVWMGNVISRCGDALNYIATLTLQRSFSDSGLLLSLLLLARMLPKVILSPIVGLMADRFDRRKVMLLSDLARLVCVLCFQFIRWPQLEPLLFVLTFLQFCFSAMFEPARSSLVPLLIESEEISTANTLDGITWSAVGAFSSALGGLITTLYGPYIDYVINAATYLSSALFIFSILQYRLEPSYRPSTPRHSNSFGIDFQTSQEEDLEKAETPTERIVEQEMLDSGHERRLKEGLEGLECGEDLQSWRQSDDCGGKVGSFSTEKVARKRELSCWYDNDYLVLAAEWVNIPDIDRPSASNNGKRESGNMLDPDILPASFQDLHQDSEQSHPPDCFDDVPPPKSRLFVANLKMIVFGCIFIRINKYVMALMLLKAGSQFIEGAVNTCNIKFSQDVYDIGGDSGSFSLGALYTVMGIASFVGPVLAKRFFQESRSGTHKLFVLAINILVLGSFMLSLVNNVWYFLLVNMIRSSGTAIIWVFTSSVLQKILADDFRGRVLAFDLGLATLSQAFGTIFSGALYQVGWDPFGIVFLVGIISANISAFWMCYFLFYSHHYSRAIVIPKS